MQIVKDSLHSIHPLFNEIEELYAFTSVKEQQRTLITPTFRSVFKPIVELFNKYIGVDYQIQYTDAQTRQMSTFVIPKSDKCVIVCYSGGKDSTATALHYKTQGYQVFLYHLKGINKTYKDEWKNVYAMGQLLNLPVIFEEVSLIGNHDWVEHPLKNWIIAGRALQYGVDHHLTTNIAFGNFSTSTLDEDPFEVCGGDCKELWNIYNSIVQTIIPDFTVKTPLENMQSTLDILLQHKDIAVKCQSCIGPYRYREYLHKNNEAKYNIKLPPHRCGSCWKCCLEYIVYTDNDIYEYNEAYYVHCLEVLQNTLKKEQELRVDLDDVWNHYFFYSREDSKYYGKRG